MGCLPSKVRTPLEPFDRISPVDLQAFVRCSLSSPHSPHGLSAIRSFSTCDPIVPGSSPTAVLGLLLSPKLVRCSRGRAAFVALSGNLEF